MSEAFDFDLTDIEEFPDVQLDDASEYQDQSGPAPLAPGNFRLQVVEAQRQTNKDGDPIDDDGYPVLVVNKVRVVEPQEFAGRELYPFQKYSLKPVSGGPRKGSVPVIDLLRGFDDTLTFQSGREALQLLNEKIEQGGSFLARTNWLAKDSSYIRTAIEAAGGNLSSMENDARKALFKVAIIRGQKNFPKNGNGGYLPEVKGPSGDVLTARVNITQIYPSSKEVRQMGPFDAKK